MPPGNIFGASGEDLPELVLTPSGEQGYYLFVKPLPRGEHTVRWLAEGCVAAEFVQDITYHLTIVPAANEVAAQTDGTDEGVGGMLAPGDLRGDD